MSVAAVYDRRSFLSVKTADPKEAPTRKIQDNLLKARLRSGERMRLACCRWRLANDFLWLNNKGNFGEAPKSAREGACAPQKKRVVARRVLFCHVERKQLSWSRAFSQTDRVGNRSDIKLTQIAVGREQHPRVRVLRRPNLGIRRAK
jgi:hypothetical protein